MPKISRYFIKTGVVYLLAGVLLAIIAEIPALSTAPLLLPVYWHMLVIGWITQVIMGVSIWMFPRKQRDRKKTDSRAAWSAYWLLNSGLVLRLLSEPFLPLTDNSTVLTTMMILSGILQVSAFIAYTAEIWPRLQSRKKQKKQSR